MSKNQCYFNSLNIAAVIAKTSLRLGSLHQNINCVEAEWFWWWTDRQTFAIIELLSQLKVTFNWIIFWNQGDSGGPFTYKQENGQHILIGVASSVNDDLGCAGVSYTHIKIKTIFNSKPSLKTSISPLILYQI